MIEPTNHPGRSPEFLSRWHDGDLSAAERVRFESHRAHCAECRDAAAEFEGALALYRSHRPRPPAPELSGRILRKLRASNRRRSTFGVTFGIDLRWAGAFAAALLAVIIGSEVVVRREIEEHRRARESAPLSIVLDRLKRSAPSGRDKSPAQPSANKALPLLEPAAHEPKTLTSSSGRLYAPAPPSESQRGAPAQAPIASSRETSADSARIEDIEKGQSFQQPAAPAAAAAPSAQAKPAPQAFARQLAGSSGSTSKPGSSGGEAGTLANMATEEKTAAARLQIVAIDDEGLPPALLNGVQVDVPAALRGKEFDLVVEASGRVLSVRPTAEAARKKALQKERKDEGELDQKQSDQPLSNLRFQPGNHPRMLRVHID